MHKLAAAALLIILTVPTNAPLAFAYDSGSGHRLSRPESDDKSGGSVASAANNNGTSIGTDVEESSAAVNQDELKSKIETWRKEAAAQDSDPATAPAPPKRVLQGSIDQYGEAKQQAFNIGLGIVARREFEASFPANIFKVLDGSKALAAGVRVGDRILKETLDKNVVHMTLKRAQRTIEVTINTGGSAMFDLGADQPALNVGAAHTTLQAGASRSSLNGGTTAVKLNANANANVVEQMRDHDVVMIIDMSGSMTTRDCQGLSRWDWVGRQSNELALAAQQASSDLSVMLFSSGFQVMDHVSPSLIPLIFQRVHPGGGTILGAPLDMALTRYFAARDANPNVKPLIITIITDGFPGDYPSVRQALVNAANATKRDGEVSITFLLIGGEVSGNRRMEELDSQLGTQRDIVNLVEFDQVLHLGVKQALSEALSGRTLQNVPLSSPGFNSFGFGGLLNGRRGFPGNGPAYTLPGGMTPSHFPSPFPYGQPYPQGGRNYP